MQEILCAINIYETKDASWAGAGALSRRDD